MDLTVAAGAFFVLYSLISKEKIRKNENPKRHKRLWVKRGRYRCKRETMPLLMQMDDSQFREFMRISREDFEILTNLIGPKIAKKDTKFRDAVAVTDRLALTLRYLATGDSYVSLESTFKISKPCISIILKETCYALTVSLKKYLKVPSDPEDWLEIAAEFQSKWNFPHCIGAIEEKYIVLHPSLCQGWAKGDFGLFFFIIVDAEYNFRYIDLSTQGRYTDNKTFVGTRLDKQLQKNSLVIPEDAPMPGQISKMPYVFVANDTFPLQRHIMVPYSRISKNATKERKFNEILNINRRVTENVIGTASSVFQVLKKPISLIPERAQNVIMAICGLHNFRRRNEYSRNLYTPPGTFDYEDADGKIIPGLWRAEDSSNVRSLLPIKGVRQGSKEAKVIRDKFADFLSKI